MNSLIKEVDALIAEVNKTHRYSMSRIYGMYNEVFNTNETPQSCASCLIRKVRELTNWLEKEKKKSDSINTEPDTEVENKTPADSQPVENKSKRGRRRK